MPATTQEKFADLFADPCAGRWLTILCQRGKAHATVDAYGRAVRDYISFCRSKELDYLKVRKDHIAAYIQHMYTQQVRRVSTRQGLSNATMQQRLVAIHKFYVFLAEEQLLTNNPVERGKQKSGRRYRQGEGSSRGLIPRYKKLPWIPSEEQWLAILIAAKAEPLRNRLMFSMAYDGALRREELCSLSFDDIDSAYKQITIQAENTKSRCERVVHYSEETGKLYAKYQRERTKLSGARGRLLLSESRRNHAQPLSIWSWSKTVQALAKRAGVPQFTTHTFRHLRLTDMARSGIELHLIALYAGHKSLETTMLYIHRSGREISEKLTDCMNSIHQWREQLN